MKPSKPKRKVSQRELWLIALLPAALVVIVSLALPGPAGEASELERRLERLAGDDTEASMHDQLEKLAEEHKASRQKLTDLGLQEKFLQAAIDAFESPAAQRAIAFNLAEGLDELSVRLAGHGVRVLAMVEDTAARGGRSAGMRSSGRSGDTGQAKPTDWQVTVAAAWPAMRRALADAETFPRGLALSAMNMEPPRAGVGVQRWELVVTGAGAAP